MYYFKYYAIGHSYLKHGPFKGWQTDGYWGMAASEPANDYFHKFREILQKNFDCKINSIAENHASYERLCVDGVTAEDYRRSKYYNHMKKVITTFKPNIITVFVGGGNTVANDEKSLTLFHDVLYDMIQKYKQPETVVICPCLNKRIAKICMPVIKKYNFIAADVSFIHSDSSRENPYYAFKDYPEYDKEAASGAVEFRTHPNNLGHFKIAECIFNSAKEEILRKISPCDENQPCDFEEDFAFEKDDEIKIITEPNIPVSFNGFNITRDGDCVSFSSAPGTGASISADNLSIGCEYNKFYVRLSVDGNITGKKLEFSFSTNGTTESIYCPIEGNSIHTYQFDISNVKESIDAFRLSPNMDDCFIRINSLGFLI